MNLQQRLQTIEEQPRAYTIGNVEFIHNQWVFFDCEDDEASMLEDLKGKALYILLQDLWIEAKISNEESGLLLLPTAQYQLQNGDIVKIKKPLTSGYETWLEQLPYRSFKQYISSLNHAGFSLYDCIYCHNHISFLAEDMKGRGTNFLLYDNEEMVCAVQHHFKVANREEDRFEFTTSTGDRSILMKTS